MPFNYTNTEVANTIKICPNPNAALKNLLKKDVQNNKELARLVKELRDICQTKINEKRLDNFIERHVLKFPHLFQAIIRHAFFDKIDRITAPIIEQHAEEFNATYQHNESSITVTNRDKFNTIAKKVIADFRAKLVELGLPNNDFMLSVLVTTLFDPPVVPEIAELA